MHSRTIPKLSSVAIAPVQLPVSEDPDKAVAIAEDLSRQYTARHAQIMSLKNLITGEGSLTKMIEKFEVHNDLEKDSAQFGELFAAVVPKAQKNQHLRMTDTDLARLLVLVYDDILGLAVIGPLWRCEAISEIMVDSPDRVVVEYKGKLRMTRIKYHDYEHALKSIRDIGIRVSGRTIGPVEPMITAELPGARAALAVAPVVRSGVTMAMRRFPKMMGMADIKAFGALNDEIENFLRTCVFVRANILISGGTSSGKTTFINSLSEFIPPGERVVSIEDAFELSLKNNMWVPMQTKERASADDTVRVGLPEILRHTLRMRPDRILVGEIREHEDAAVLLQAANTGHDGTMTTIHANTADDAVNFRLNYLLRKGQGEMPVDVAAAEIASAIDIVVQVVRERGVRFVKEVSVIDRALLRGPKIMSKMLWQGYLQPPDQPGGKPRPAFKKIGSIPNDTTIALKLEEAVALQKSAQAQGQ